MLRGNKCLENSYSKYDYSSFPKPIKQVFGQLMKNSASAIKQLMWKHESKSLSC